LIFVDANVPMYLVGARHPHKLDVQQALARVTAERRQLVTSSEVFQELMHRYSSANRRDWIEIAFDALRAIVDQVFAVDRDDVLLAKDILYAHPKLTSRDAVHVAVMRRREIREIMTFDSGFDSIAEIERVPSHGA
jgi:uncharacterized protein